MTGHGPTGGHRTPSGLRLVVALAVATSLVMLTGMAVGRLTGPPAESAAAAPVLTPARLKDPSAAPGRPGPDGDPGRRTLILYQARTSDEGLGHTYAVQAANLASRGGSWVIRPIEEYAAAELDQYQAAIYVGTSTDADLPPAFLDDVAAGRTPVLWFGENIQQLFGEQPTRPVPQGWRPGPDETVDVRVVRYKDRALDRTSGLASPVKRIELLDPAVATALGTAESVDGQRHPWAVRSGALTYVAEIPFADVGPRDRYLAAADLVLHLVAPSAPERKRALVRIEDVGPNTDPEQIRRIADTLSARGIPFSLATYPYYRDPTGAEHEGEPASFRLVDQPKLVEALVYARARGATIVMHGYSHQLESAANPYNGTSGADFEFYAAHVDAQNAVQLDGPVPGDSRQWAADRLAVGRGEFVRVGLPDPDIFEFPHYAGSADSYQAVHDAFGVRYDQGTYFAGLCPSGRCSTADPADKTGMFQQFFPYPVRDVYGSVVIPENLGNVSFAYNNNPARNPQDVVDNAGALTVVSDSVASTFFHPFLPIEQLEQVVDGIRGYGYTFVTPYDVLGSEAPR